MKTLSILTMTILFTIAFVENQAIAQTQHQGGMGQRMQMMCPMQSMRMHKQKSESRTKGRIAFLKAELGITETQATLFEAYAESVANNLMQMQNMRSKMHAMMTAETAVERLNAHIDMMEGRLASLKTMQEPMQSLFEVLSDQQKKKANQLIDTMACMQ